MSHNLETFLSQASTYNAIPLQETVVYDAHTPLTALNHFKSEPNFIFLEGISPHMHQGRYSYLALDAHIELVCQATQYTITSNETSVTKTGSVYDAIAHIMAQYHTPPDTPDYVTGILGNLSYECLAHLEDVPLSEKRALDTPFAVCMVPKTLLIFDTLYHTLTISHTIFLPTEHNMTPKSLTDQFNDGLARINAIKKTLTKPDPITPVFLPNTIENYSELPCSMNGSESEFLEQVNACKRYIKEGDIFQVQISRRAEVPFSDDPFLLYRYLRNFNPSPLLFYLKNSDYSLVGASPEIVVNVENNIMTIRPIAGTRKRYSRDKSESEIVNELSTDEKEKAEHIMLVDLARNDIGRACEIDSVTVNELMIIEKYTHVMHMVSDISGKLKQTYNAIDALKFGFPHGTVTGAPKVRAMEIIAECESQQREFYSGGVIFFDFNNNLKSALTIRSILVKDNKAYTQAAAGVVADSIPEMELKETKNKMRSSLSAMVQFGDLS